VQENVAVQCRTIVVTSGRLRGMTSEGVKASGRYIVEADRIRVSLRVKIRVVPGLQLQNLSLTTNYVPTLGQR
jgi:hypothetical protein